MYKKICLMILAPLMLIGCGGKETKAQENSGTGNIDLTSAEANEWLLGQCESKMLKAVDSGALSKKSATSVCKCKMSIYKKLDSDERIKLAWFEEALAQGAASSVAPEDRPGPAASAALRKAREKCSVK